MLDKINTAYEIVINLERSDLRKLDEEDVDILEVGYLARRITDVIENAFVAFDLANDIVKILGKPKNENFLVGFLVSILYKDLKICKSKSTGPEAGFNRASGSLI